MAKAIYNGVDNVARQVEQPYIGVDNVSRNVTEGYIGVDNVARQCFSSGASWGKYSCNVSSGYYTEYQESDIEIWESCNLNSPTKVYTSYTFSWDGGIELIGETTVTFTSSTTLKTVQRQLEGKYIGGWLRLSYIKSVLQVQARETDFIVYGIYDSIYADWTPPEYNKGNTLYDSLTAPEGELPEDGTLIEGSYEEGYCVLEIGGTYYYYVLED